MNTSSARFGALAGAVAALLLLALIALSPTLFGLEWLPYDAATRMAARRNEPDPRILIIAINEKSIATLEEFYGRPPYSRELMARVVDELDRAGASVVAFDILFSEPNVHDEAGDRLFADALEKMPVVLAAQTDPRAGSDAPSLASKLWSVTGPDRIAHRRVIAPISLFSTPAAIGSVRLITDPTSSVAHDYATLDSIVQDRRAIASLGFEVARAVRNSPREARLTPHTLETAGLSIPIRRDATFAIQWHAHSKSAQPPYTIVDFDQLIINSLSREEPTAGRPVAEIDRRSREMFGGKIVLVGYTAGGLFDLRATPLAPARPGVEIHAHAIDDLINGEFNRSVSPLALAVLLLLALSSFGALAARIRSQTIAAAMLAAATGIWLGGAAALHSRGWIVPIAGPVIGLLLTSAVMTSLKFIAEKRQTRQLKATFGRYVSPQILDYILANPDKVHLGGERREMTILFSDIRGFTTISEASEPEEVVEMLNEYLTDMVEILLRHGGTLDKFIGDAVMGFWNAPTADPDHAQHAVACAIEMIDATARLRERWSTEGKAAIRIGVGVNTGEAVVGNIGSRQVFGYTVIGDAVNLASRLEGKNKDYGTEIIISESTKQRIDPAIPTVYLDDVKVKGKEIAVRIYQIKGTVHSPSTLQD